MNWIDFLKKLGISAQAPDPLPPSSTSASPPVTGEVVRGPLDLPRRWSVETDAIEHNAFLSAYESSHDSITQLWRRTTACVLVRKALKAASSERGTAWRWLLESDEEARERLSLAPPPAPEEPIEKDGKKDTDHRQERQEIEAFAGTVATWLKSPTDLTLINQVCKFILRRYRYGYTDDHNLAVHLTFNALNLLGPDAAESMPEIVNAGLWDNHRPACDALASIGREAFPSLVQIAESGHDGANQYAVATLASFGTAAIPSLIKVLGGYSPEPIEAAANALTLFGRNASSAAPEIYNAWIRMKRDSSFESLSGKVNKQYIDKYRKRTADAATACQKALKSITGVKLFDVSKNCSYDDFIKHNIEQEALSSPAKPADLPARPGSNPGYRSVMLDGLMESVPNGLSYDELTRQLGEINHELKERFIDRLQPVLNAEAQGRPHETLDMKKELATWINDELAKLGLAVKFPGTDLPARFAGDRGNRPGVGRFEFQYYGEGSRRRANSDMLPTLELTDAYPPSDWVDRAGGEKGGVKGR